MEELIATERFDRLGYGLCGVQEHGRRMMEEDQLHEGMQISP
jgi:hypothetical protein